MKLCIWCEHFNFDSGWGGTDVTPGDPAELECNKGHWNLNGMYLGVNEYRRCMLTAQKCPDYQLAEGLTQQELQTA